MRVLLACKRGNIAPRDRTGHCLCEDCVAFNRKQRRAQSAKRRDKIKAWNAANPDRQRLYQAKWRQSNPEKARAVVASWRARNPEAVAKMNAKAGAKWSKENAGARNALTAKRKSALLLRTPAWADHAAIAEIYQESARLTLATGVQHEVDHVIPLQGQNVCGLHVANNLQILPRRANRAKQNKMEAWDAA